MTGPVDKLPPTEYLVMEVLAARWRLGEPSWPFPSNLRPTLESLRAKYLIDYWRHTVEGAWGAAFTDEGRRAWGNLPDHKPRPAYRTIKIRRVR